MHHLKSTYKYLIVIGIGLAIFLVDYFELINTLSNEIVLAVLSLLKAGYFIFFVFRTIKETAQREFDFHEFLGFVVVSILLVIFSFAIDYYCLFRIDAHSFAGVIAKQNILTEFINFIYYSISVFTTAGFGDIKPNSTSAQIFVSTELMIAFFFTILVIANIGHLRSSYVNKKNGR